LPNQCKIPAADVSRVTRPDLGETPEVSLGPVSVAAHGPVTSPGSNRSDQPDTGMGNITTATVGEEKDGRFILDFWFI